MDVIALAKNRSSLAAADADAIIKNEQLKPSSARPQQAADTISTRKKVT
jgi:hypothetical protein